jgi:Helix-turn-helix domain
MRSERAGARRYLVERGDSGGGRDAYGRARRRGNPRNKPGTSDYGQDGDGDRGYFGDGLQPGEDGFHTPGPQSRGDGNGVDGDYSQLLRRPADRQAQTPPPPRPSRFRPGRGRLRQPGSRQPNRNPPPNGGPRGALGDSSLLNGRAPNGELRNDGFPRDGFMNGTRPSGGPANGGPPNGAPAGGRRPNGGPVNSGQGYDGLPDDFAADGGSWTAPDGGGPWTAPDGGPWTGWTPGSDAPDGRRADGRPTGPGPRYPGGVPRYPAGGPRASAGAGRVPPDPGRQYLASNGRRVPPRADRLFRSPGAPQPGAPGTGAPGTGMPGTGTPGTGTPGTGTPGTGIPRTGGRRTGMPGSGGSRTGMPGTGGPGTGMPGSAGPGAGMPGPGGAGAGMPGGAMPRPGYAPGAGRAGAGYRRPATPPPRPRYGEQTTDEQHQSAVSGQVIRQRDNALPEPDQISASQPIASIAPDGLDSFARDLRALRAKAELDYEEMAERSHYTMKTLASAAGGLRLPTLPVAVAYVRACGGDVAEWEDRWHKLAEKITAEAAKKQGDSEDSPEPTEASEATRASQVSPGPPTPGPQQPGQAGQSEVYVITSAKPRQPGSPDPRGNDHPGGW